MSKWQVNKAKSHFSELLNRAENEGPQIITRHGDDKAVLLSIREFKKLKAAQPDFREYLLAGPKVDDLEIDRPRDTGRKIEI